MADKSIYARENAKYGSDQNISFLSAEPTATGEPDNGTNDACKSLIPCRQKWLF
jgi:hypothetical protein